MVKTWTPKGVVSKLKFIINVYRKNTMHVWIQQGWLANTFLFLDSSNSVIKTLLSYTLARIFTGEL